MPEKTPDTAPEETKRRNQRNVAIALGLAAFILVVFLVTILRISGNLGSVQ
jgi:hypothetical protein